MDIMESSLGSEVVRITTDGSGVFPYISAIVHTPVGDIEVLDVLNFDIMRDFLEQYCDETTAVFLIPRGQFSFRMALNPDNLEVTITRSSGEVHGATRGSATIVNRYKLMMSKPIDPSMNAAGQRGLDEFTMDLQGFEAVEVQLFEPLMERFAMQTTGGIYRDTPVSDIVRALLVGSSDVGDLDEDYKLLAVDMVEPDDNSPRKHVVIPHGTPTHDAVGYIQKKAGGIYSGSISYFYQNDMWYVFPPFDFTRYNDASRQLNIYRVPENRLPHIEKSMLVHGSVISIIATGEFVVDNKIQNRKIAEGNGAMFSDASTLFEKGVEVKENKAVFSRASNNNEFVAKQQSSGLNKLTMSSARITANMLQQSSIIASKEGCEIQLIWQNSNPDLLTPGMQTRISFLRDGIIREAQGVLIGVQTSISNTGQGITNKHKQCHSALRLWVDPDEV